jgi:hypothetical protein
MMRPALVSVALLAAVACDDADEQPIDIAIGIDADDRRQLVPRSAHAELLVVRDVKQELRVTLSSQQIECGGFSEVDSDAVTLTLTFLSGPEQPPRPGEYPWLGTPPSGRPARPLVVPTARVGARSVIFPEGGSVRLTRVELSPRGHIEGLLELGFAGNAEREATSVRGRFDARVCRLDRP